MWLLGDYRLIRVNFIPEVVLYKSLGESAMAHFAIKCPVTQGQVSIGIRVDAARWNQRISFTGYTWCPHCGRDHEWSAKDVILCEGAELRPSANTTRDVALLATRLGGLFKGIPYLRYS